MDTIKSPTGVAGQFGLFRITPDSLRGVARFLGAAAVGPLAYTLDIDGAL